MHCPPFKPPPAFPTSPGPSASCDRSWRDKNVQETSPVQAMVGWSSLKYVLNTRSFHCANWDTNHSLVCCKIHMQPQKFHDMKQAGVLHFAISGMSCPDLHEQFADTFEKELSSTDPEITAIERWYVHPSTGQPWPHLERRQQKKMTRLRPSLTRWVPSSGPKGPTLLSTNVSQMRGTFRFSGKRPLAVVHEWILDAWKCEDIKHSQAISEGRTMVVPNEHFLCLSPGCHS